MGWRRVLQCTTAPLLHYSSHTEPIQWKASVFFFFSFTLNVCKERSGEGWMISTCCDFCVLLSMFTGRTSTQLNWGIIKQTHQTGLLVTMPKFPRRKTLIRCVGSQTRWREVSRAHMCFDIWRDILSRRWKVLGLAPTPFIFSETAATARSIFDGQTECVSSQWFKGSALSQLIAFYSAVSNAD